MGYGHFSWSAILCMSTQKKVPFGAYSPKSVFRNEVQDIWRICKSDYILILIPLLQGSDSHFPNRVGLGKYHGGGALLRIGKASRPFCALGDIIEATSVSRLYESIFFNSIKAVLTTEMNQFQIKVGRAHLWLLQVHHSHGWNLNFGQFAVDVWIVLVKS